MSNMGIGIAALQGNSYTSTGNSSYPRFSSGRGSKIHWRKYLNWRTYDAFLYDLSRGTRRTMDGVADRFRRTEIAPIESEDLNSGSSKSERVLDIWKSQKVVQKPSYDETQRSKAKTKTENPDDWRQLSPRRQSPYRENWIAEDVSRSQKKDLTSDTQSFVVQSSETSSSRLPANITASRSGNMKVDIQTRYDMPTSEKDSSALATPTDGTTTPPRLSMETQSPDDTRDVHLNVSTGINSLPKFSQQDAFAVARRCGIPEVLETLNRGSEDIIKACRYLGQGSLGFVEEVRVGNLRLETFVRKRIHFSSAQRKLEIEKEVNIIKDLHHPHIVQLLGSYEDYTQGKKSFYCLLMSPVATNDLKGFLEEVGERKGDHKLKAEERFWVQSWFSCLASALAYMHDQGVRHQDIKPSNIVHRGKQIFFTDFSASSTFIPGQTTSSENPAYATAMYAAPEVKNRLQGDNYVRHGRPADIFSLGCVFSEMLSIYHDKSVHEFQDFISYPIRDEEYQYQGPESTRAYPIQIYSRTAYRMAVWFNRVVDMKIFTQFFETFIAPMISLNKDDRPTAHDLRRNFETHPYYWQPCQCTEPSRAFNATKGADD